MCSAPGWIRATGPPDGACYGKAPQRETRETHMIKVTCSLQIGKCGTISSMIRLHLRQWCATFLQHRKQCLCLYTSPCSPPPCSELAHHSEVLLQRTAGPYLRVTRYRCDRRRCRIRSVEYISYGVYCSERSHGGFARVQCTAMLLLHISDIHFKKTEVDQPDQPNRALRTAMIGDVKKMRSDWRAGPTVSWLSGDVAYAGKAEEYDFAYAWLRS